MSAFKQFLPGTSRNDRDQVLPTTTRHSGHVDEIQDHEKPRQGPDGPVLDKVKCLDGLRGIACLIVFNYHYLWPWTPLIFLPYGARPPWSPEAYDKHYHQLPIIRLLYSGRPMVAIFFTISGYVLCRHIIRSIHQRKLEAAFRSLGSAVLRRAFRLYIPVTISMLLVAILAQLGAFKSEKAVYQGPDSIYINGTMGPYGLARFFKNSTISAYLPAGPGGLTSSKGFLYNNGSIALNGTLHGLNGTAKGNETWVRFGGMWEEHPYIHPNVTYAIANFTRVYADWANPFTFNPQHPRMDPHAYTIPMELRGSMILYLFLLGTAAVKMGWRLSAGVFIAFYCMRMGRWEVFDFIGGMLLSEVHVACSFGRPVFTTFSFGSVRFWSSRRGRLLHRSLIVVALYLMSYPDNHGKYTPGFKTLAWLSPSVYTEPERWRFWQSLGAITLLPCILRSDRLRALLEMRIPQYLGKISFSLYLVHGPVLHSLGFWILPRLFDKFGMERGLLLGYPLLLSTSLYLAELWYRKIDSWSIGIGKRVERAVLDDSYKQ
ncbi:putative Acyltransferase 3 [Seiridium cardinale]|uniref:Acyltransferase 3 n=1 Tax=Seiridium cardinale TaxID=138064 RepID=A0ABR2XAK6_9PEZI